MPVAGDEGNCSSLSTAMVMTSSFLGSSEFESLDASASSASDFGSDASLATLPVWLMEVAPLVLLVWYAPLALPEPWNWNTRRLVVALPAVWNEGPPVWEVGLLPVRRILCSLDRIWLSSTHP